MATNPNIPTVPPYPTTLTESGYSDLPALPTPLPTVKPTLNDQGPLYNVPQGTSYSGYNKGYGIGSPSYAVPQSLAAKIPNVVFSKPPELYGTGTLKAISSFNSYNKATSVLGTVSKTYYGSGYDIKQIQTNLAYQGYYKGNANGKLDEATISAYNSWAKANNKPTADKIFKDGSVNTNEASSINTLNQLDKQTYDKEKSNGFRSVRKDAKGQEVYSNTAKKEVMQQASKEIQTQSEVLSHFYGGDLDKVALAAKVNETIADGIKDASSFETMLKGFNQMSSDNLGDVFDGLKSDKDFALDQASEQLKTLMATDSKFARAVENYLEDNDELQNEFINVAGCSGARPPAKQDGTLAMPKNVELTPESASAYVAASAAGATNATAGSSTWGVGPPAGFTGGAEPPATGVISSGQIDGMIRGSGQNPGNSFAEPANAGNTSQIDQEKTNEVTDKAQKEAKNELKKKKIASECAPGVVNVTQLHAATGGLTVLGVLCDDGKLSAVHYCDRAKARKNTSRTGKTSVGRNTTGGSRKGISNMNPLNALKSAMGRGFPGKGGGGGMSEEDIRASFKEDPLESLRKYYEDFANSLGTKSVLEILLPELYSTEVGGAFEAGTQKQMTETYIEYVGALLTDQNTIDLQKLFSLLYFGSLTYSQFISLDPNLSRIYFEFLFYCNNEGLYEQVDTDIDVNQITEITMMAMKAITGYYFNFINTDLTAYQNQIIIPPSPDRIAVINALTDAVKSHIEIYGKFYTIKLFSLLMFSVPNEDSTIINDDTLKQMYFDFRNALQSNGFDEDQTYTASEYVEFIIPAFESIFN